MHKHVKKMSGMFILQQGVESTDVRVFQLVLIPLAIPMTDAGKCRPVALTLKVSCNQNGCHTIKYSLYR